MQHIEYMDRHRISERETDEGFAVISRLGPGETCAYARTMSVKLVLEGEEVFRVGRRVIRVPAGAMMVLEANEAVIGSVRSDATGLCISLPKTYESKLGKDLDTEKEHGLLLRAQDSGIGRFLEKMAHDAANTFREGGKPAPLSANFRRRLHSTLPDLIQEYALNLRKTGAGSMRTSRARLHNVNYARTYIAERRRRSLSLGEIAGAAGISQHALSLHFTKVFGEAPMAFHRRLRLAAAFDDLTLGYAPDQTAIRTGFGSYRGFRSSFQQAYGVPPEKVCRSRPRN